MKSRFILPALLMYAWAFAAPSSEMEAILVVRENVLEGGKVVEYVGAQRHTVRSEADLERLLLGLSRKPRPARFVFNQDKGWIAVEKTGYSFDRARASAAYSEAQKAGRHEFVLPVLTLAPKQGVVELYQQGIVELIGEGRTNFRGSLPSRVHNIRLASSRFEGVRIPAGSVFSFNRTLGPVTAAAGYQKAWVIRGSRTVWDVGGGVCQVCTTVFRAAYFSGLPLVERYPHSYQVGYYKPTGLDATTAPPKDLRFKNDTPGPILIQTSIDGYELIFRFFGRKDRTVTWRGPYVSERIPPLPTRYTYDSNLPRGYRRQIDFAAEGAVVRVYRTVRLNNGVVRSDTLTSRYRPWGAVYLLGPRR